MGSPASPSTKSTYLRPLVPALPVPFWAKQFFSGSHLIVLSPFLLHFPIGLQIVPTVSCVISFFLSNGCHHLSVCCHVSQIKPGTAIDSLHPILTSCPRPMATLFCAGFHCKPYENNALYYLCCFLLICPSASRP